MSRPLHATGWRPSPHVAPHSGTKRSQLAPIPSMSPTRSPSATHPKSARNGSRRSIAPPPFSIDRLARFPFFIALCSIQLVDEDPDKAIALFWAAINAGDRVDSALKDMAIVMKQQNREEEAIKSLRRLCSDEATCARQRCGRLDDQIALLKHKLQLIQKGLAFNGKRTKTARSQGRKFQVTLEQESEQESTRFPGNWGWALMQKENYAEAEEAYRLALQIGADSNKRTKTKQGRIAEAKDTLKLVRPVKASADGLRGVVRTSRPSRERRRCRSSDQS